MGPFWNIIKINQVIGRARRISSHANLPINQRNVKVYEYISKLSYTQLNSGWKKGDVGENEVITPDGIISADSDDKIQNIFIKNKEISEELRNEDKGQTSDENLKTLSENKNSLMSSFLKLMQNSSVDCDYNLIENRKSIEKDICCVNTENLPKIENNYIYLPGNDNYTQITSKKLIGDTQPIISSKKIALKVQVRDDNYIAYFLDILTTSSTRIPMIDIYKYYGLDSSLPAPTFKPEIIGEVEFNEFNDPIFYFDSDFINDIDKIEKYIILEKTREEVSKINKKKYGEIPENSKIMLEWIELNRKLNKTKLELIKKEDISLVEETDLESKEEEAIDDSEIKQLFGIDEDAILQQENPKIFIKNRLKELKKGDKENFARAGKLGKSILGKL